MIDALLERTALPNRHPALVHFPVALVAVALLFDAGVLIRGRWLGIERSAAILWVLAALGTIRLPSVRISARYLEGAPAGTREEHGHDG